MNGSYLLDTNIVIALFADEFEVTSKLANADQVFLPSIVVGELYYGAKKSEKVIHNLERIDDLCFFHNNSIIVLTNGFQKKSQKTPKEEIKLAEEYRKDYLERFRNE